MATIDFIDEVKVFIRAGNGGAGSRHFRRERFVPRGGPDGGDGGRGGHVILVGDRNLSTLLDFRYRKHLRAPHGEAGSGSQCKGAQAADLLVKVPLGTVIKNEEGIIQGEVNTHDEQYIVAKGGRGGLGNTHFKSARNQAPQYAQPGEKREELPMILELKLLGDVGLVGEPNAGKSTLLSVVSAARPKIANYPFTTLVPNLGVVRYLQDGSFVMADIPGLIKGAAQGKGLGLRFLRHIERTRVLLFMISLEEEDIMRSYEMLQHELRTHQRGLLDKKHLLVLTKVDLLDGEELAEKLASIPKGCDYVTISSVAQKGIDELKHAIWRLLHPVT